MVLVALPNLRSGSPILAPSGEREAVRRAKRRPRQRLKQQSGQAVRRRPVIRRPVKSSPGPGEPGIRGRVMALRGTVVVVREWGSAVRVRSSRAWAPVSARLHEAMDRLESRDVASTSLTAVAPTVSAAAPAPERADPVSDMPPRATGSAPKMQPGSTTPTSTTSTTSTSTTPTTPTTPTSTTPTSMSTMPSRTTTASYPTASYPAVVLGPKRDRFDVEAITRARARTVGRPRSRPAVSGPTPVIDLRPSAVPDQRADHRPERRTDQRTQERVGNRAGERAEGQAGSARRTR